MADYTKGKWEANLFTTFKGEVIYAIHAYPEATRIKRVAEVFEEANAQLIAAAPDTHEELKEADRVICELCYIVNPQHATADYGVGCKSCEDRERRLQVLAKVDNPPAL